MAAWLLLLLACTSGLWTRRQALVWTAALAGACTCICRPSMPHSAQGVACPGVWCWVVVTTKPDSAPKKATYEYVAAATLLRHCKIRKQVLMPSNTSPWTQARHWTAVSRPLCGPGSLHGFSPALLQAVLLNLQSLVVNSWLLSVIVAVRSQRMMLHGVLQSSRNLRLGFLWVCPHV